MYFVSEFSNLDSNHEMNNRKDQGHTQHLDQQLVSILRLENTYLLFIKNKSVCFGI